MTRASYQLVHLESCPSTQDEAWKRVCAGARIVAVRAARQTAGRGRQDRHWVSPAGNLFLSLGFSLDGYKDRAWPFVSLLAGLASARSLEQLGAWDEACFLKWPNDLYRRDPASQRARKMGGILTELRKGVLLVGVGINVTHAPSLDGASYQSDSISSFTSQPPSATQLAETLVRELTDLILDWLDDGTRLTAHAITELETNWMRPFFSMRGHVDSLGEVRAERLLGDGRLEVCAIQDSKLKQALSSGEFRLLD